jgi:hypothetical protein
MTTNIHKQLYFYLKSSEKWHFAKLTIINLGATMQLSKHTFGSHPPITGPEFTPTYFDIPKPVSVVSKENLPWINLHLCIHFRRRINPTSGSTLIFSVPCSLQDDNTNTFFASLMHSQNMPLITAIENKEAETVAKAIFSEGFCKFGIPAQIHTDGGKEFVNKQSRELFDLLNVEHTKMTPAHPQCNAQVEVFNKTVKKYLASFVDDTMLDWENFLPALMLSYNTSYHSTIATTPFELLFGTKPRLPSFSNPDIQRVHYGESTSAEGYQLLQKTDFSPKTLQRQSKTIQNQILTKMRFHTHSMSTI